MNDETKQPAGETPEPVAETRDRLAQRRPDPPDAPPRKMPEQPKAPPWFLHPDERRSFERLVKASREYAGSLKGEHTFPMEPDALIKEILFAGAQIEGVCDALDRCLESDQLKDREIHRLTKESSGLLDTVARWQDYGEGRIPQLATTNPGKKEI